MDNFNQTTPQQNESQPVNHQGNKVVHICKFCGAAISKEEKTCPNCGAKNKKPIFKRAWFWI
ncbi:MAG: zinc-ribbon domain-containing protein, partial [Acutalibacteraceae bacterium]